MNPLTSQNLNISVLFVEDDEMNLMLFERIISPMVNKLHLASNGQQALQMYYDYQPDLVITDLEMPIMNGAELIKHIYSTNPDQKIIVLSAHTSYPNIPDQVTYLVKPLQKKNLEQTLYKLFS